MKSINKTQNRAIGKGLYYLFFAELFSLLSVISALGSITLVISSFISIYALYNMFKAEPKYQPAFIFSVVHVLMALLVSYYYISHAPAYLTALFEMAFYVPHIAMLYCICTTTGKALERLNPALSQRASLIWKIFLFYDLLVIARILLTTSGAPETMFTSETANVVTVIVSIGASLFYLFFLWQSQTLLQKD